MLTKPRMLALGALLLLVVPASPVLAQAPPPPPPPPAPSAPPAALSNVELRAFILSKLTYDREYFDDILRLSAQNLVHPRLTPAKFAGEVKRAKANQPVLHQLFEDLATPPKDGMLRLPPTSEVHREYTNLIGLLNMMYANDHQDYPQVLRQGERLKVQKREDFGHVRGDSERYYVNLYRLYFFLMAFAHYSLGQDGSAVEWLGRLEADANLKALKSRLGDVTQQTNRELRRDELRSKPVAVMPFACAGPDQDLAWAASALTEILTTDLVQGTDLTVVERSQLDKVMDEAALGAAGFVKDDVARDIGRLSGAGALLMGSFQRKGKTVLMAVRLVDSLDAQVLAAQTAELAEDDLIPGTRALVLKLFGELGWSDGINAEDILASQTPKVPTLKTLHAARLKRSSNPAEAKALFAQAMKEDPAVANLYRELRLEFKDVTATLAVLDITNLSGLEEDAWMARGVAQGLTADLPNLGFRVVERARMEDVMEAREAAQGLQPQQARQLGEQLGADFVVLGSVLHQKPRIRVDVRFVDVRTGVIAQSMGAESRNNDLMAVLTGLSSMVAARFNHPLGPKEIDALAGKQRNAADYEAFIRQELAQEALRASSNGEVKTAGAVKPASFKLPPAAGMARIAAYSVAAAVVASSALVLVPAALVMVGGLVQAAVFGAVEYQLKGVRAAAEDEQARQTPGAREVQAQQQAWGWLGVAAGGAGVMVLAGGVLLGTAGVLALERVVVNVVDAVKEGGK